MYNAMEAPKQRNNQGLKLSDSYLLGNKFETKKIDPGGGGGGVNGTKYITEHHGQIMVKLFLPISHNSKMRKHTKL